MFLVMATIPKQTPDFLLGESETRMTSCSKERLSTVAIVRDSAISLPLVDATAC
jgi:hypothetical protein